MTCLVQNLEQNRCKMILSIDQYCQPWKPCSSQKKAVTLAEKSHVSTSCTATREPCETLNVTISCVDPHL